MDKNLHLLALKSRVLTQSNTNHAQNYRLEQYVSLNYAG